MLQPWKKPFGKAKALEYEIELEAGVTVTRTTAELASLLTRAFEMLEQFFNCFTDGLES